jgi:hypothetical protein
MGQPTAFNLYSPPPTVDGERRAVKVLHRDVVRAVEAEVAHRRVVLEAAFAEVQVAAPQIKVRARGGADAVAGEAAAT